MKLSRDAKEIIKTIVFVLIVAALIIAYAVYPLSRTKAYYGRTGIDDFNADTTLFNNDSLWVAAGLIPDTFKVEADGWVTLAGLYLEPDSVAQDSIPGTVLLVHGDDGTRDDMRLLAQVFADSDYVVIAYDQRASGASTGKYTGEGGLEATDMEALVGHLELRQQIAHPLAVVGYGLGGDAALLAAQEDSRIDQVVAVDPHLSTKRFMDRLRQRHDGYWFPLYRMIMWFWYNIRSSYGEPFRKAGDIDAVACPTVVLLPEDAMDIDEVTALRELSDPQMLRLLPLSDGDEAVFRAVFEFAPGP